MNLLSGCCLATRYSVLCSLRALSNLAGALRFLAFLKLFERVYATLTAGLLAAFRGDRNLSDDNRCQLDRLYQCISDDLDALLRAVGIKIAA